jgi:hypothetical protein
MVVKPRRGEIIKIVKEAASEWRQTGKKIIHKQQFPSFGGASDK